jgi:hypothetical protein
MTRLQAGVGRLPQPVLAHRGPHDHHRPPRGQVRWLPQQRSTVFDKLRRPKYLGTGDQYAHAVWPGRQATASRRNKYALSPPNSLPAQQRSPLMRCFPAEWTPSGGFGEAGRPVKCGGYWRPRQNYAEQAKPRTCIGNPTQTLEPARPTLSPGGSSGRSWRRAFARICASARRRRGHRSGGRRRHADRSPAGVKTLCREIGAESEQIYKGTGIIPAKTYAPTASGFLRRHHAA